MATTRRLSTMTRKRLVLAAMLAGASLAPTGTVAEDTSIMHKMPTEMRSLKAQPPTGGELPSLGSATAWLNTPPLTAADLGGKVVLIDFWTYTCINWLRTVPYVRAWAEKYKDQGLVVIGVHTPEFGFEKNLDNVRRATQAMGLTFPIAVDNDYAIWRGFRNQYWPALYFVD